MTGPVAFINNRAGHFESRFWILPETGSRNHQPPERQRLFLNVTTVAVGLGFKCPLPIVTDATEFSFVDLCHSDGDGSLFHFWKHIFIMAFHTLDSGILVNLSGKSYRPHRAFGELNGFPRRNRDHRRYHAKGQYRQQQQHFFHRWTPFQSVMARDTRIS